jgi:hypothetical protein
MKIGLLGIQLILLVLWYTVATTMPAWVVFLPLIVIGVIIAIMAVVATSVIITGGRGLR